MVQVEILSHDEVCSLLRARTDDALAQEAATRIGYLSAQEQLLQTWQDKADALAAELAETKRPLDAQMATLNKALIDANAHIAALTVLVAGQTPNAEFTERRQASGGMPGSAG